MTADEEGDSVQRKPNHWLGVWGEALQWPEQLTGFAGTPREDYPGQGEGGPKSR